MSATATLDRPIDATALIADMGARARRAAAILAGAPTHQKAAALTAAAQAIRA
ncbi:MAG: gamma-glutamyl-phosphate reductase, partial [Sphingomonas sp.]|nr:gamma-glutamyl-phosphate reductase [Sphingomonas sp.]